MKTVVLKNQLPVVGPMPAFFIGSKEGPCDVFFNLIVTTDSKFGPAPVLNIASANPKKRGNRMKAIQLASFLLQ